MSSQFLLYGNGEYYLYFWLIGEDWSKNLDLSSKWSNFAIFIFGLSIKFKLKSLFSNKGFLKFIYFKNYIKKIKK